MHKIYQCPHTYKKKCMYTHAQEYIEVGPTVVESDQKVPFSIATTQRCRGKALLFLLDCSTLPLIRTLKC